MAIPITAEMASTWVLSTDRASSSVALSREPRGLLLVGWDLVLDWLTDDALVVGRRLVQGAVHNLILQGLTDDALEAGRGLVNGDVLERLTDHTLVVGRRLVQGAVHNLILEGLAQDRLGLLLDDLGDGFLLGRGGLIRQRGQCRA